MRFSPFNPIRFFLSDAPCTGQGGYVRTFSESDCIMLEVFYGKDEELPVIDLYDEDSAEVIGALSFKEYRINSDEYLGILERSGFSTGNYTMKIGDFVSECVRVVSDDDLTETVLIQYADRDNRKNRDILTKMFGGIRYFSLRIPGGFKDSGWMFKVDNDRFISPSGDPVELYSMDYTDKVLTIGTPSGVDVNTLALVNRILTCPLVFIDGVRYARSEGATLENEAVAENERLVSSVLLREAHHMIAEMELAIRLNLRRTPLSLRRAANRPRRYL